MAIGAAIAGGIASAAVGAIANKALGPKMPKGSPAARPKGFTSPGAIISKGPGGTFGLERGIGVTQALSGLTDLNTRQAGAIGSLLEQVRPGMGRLTQSRLTAVSNARERAIGNLKENLSRRRVMGSSFAEDALTRAELEFGQEAEKVRAESFLQELEMTSSLIKQQHDTLRTSFATALEQSNFESQLAANYANGVNVVLSQNAALQAQLQAQQMQLGAGAAAGIGKFLEPAITGIGDAVSKWYSSTPTTNPSGTTTGWVP